MPSKFVNFTNLDEIHESGRGTAVGAVQGRVTSRDLGAAPVVSFDGRRSVPRGTGGRIDHQTATRPTRVVIGGL